MPSDSEPRAKKSKTHKEYVDLNGKIFLRFQNIFYSAIPCNKIAILNCFFTKQLSLKIYQKI